MTYPIEFREAKRDAFCRGCDTKIEKGEHMVTTYSFRNQGQNIHFCVACADEIGRMVKDHENVTLKERG
jgi:hypothetical protein